MSPNPAELLPQPVAKPSQPTIEAELTEPRPEKSTLKLISRKKKGDQP